MRSFRVQNDQFFTFAFGLKVIQLFKAKMEAFRARKFGKVENVPFWLHLTPNFLVRDETRFFYVLNPEPSAKPMLLLTFC